MSNFPVSVSIGDTPPPNPNPASIWFSTHPRDVRFSTAVWQKQLSIVPDQTYEGAIIASNTGGAVLETSVVYAAGKWHQIYTTGNGGGAGAGYASASGPGGPWAKRTAGTIISGGTVLHGFAYVEDPIVYYYYHDGAGNIVVKSADASAATFPATWSAGTNVITGLQPSSNNYGNISITKNTATGTYFLYVEMKWKNNSYWMIGLWTSTSPTGPFTAVAVPMGALEMPVSQIAGGGQPYQYTIGGTHAMYVPGDNSFVMFLHTGDTNENGLRSVIRRAVSPDGYGWTMDSTEPLLIRSFWPERDQVADPFYARQGPDTIGWMYWEGVDNQTGVPSVICCQPAIPALMMWDGFSWASREIGSGTLVKSTFTLEALNMGGAATFTASDGQDLYNDITAAGCVVTLPVAAVDSWCRVAALGTGVNTITFAVQGTDAVVGTAVVLTVGQCATWRCLTSGKWNRVG